MLYKHNTAPRHHRRLRLAAVAAPARQPYVLISPTARPDLRGEFAGVKVQRDGNQMVVFLSERQARFYLDQGVIRLLEPPTPSQKA